MNVFCFINFPPTPSFLPKLASLGDNLTDFFISTSSVSVKLINKKAQVQLISFYSKIIK